MRKLLISLVAVFAVTGVSFAQDAGAPNRSLSFYLDAFSGHLTDGTDGSKRTFADNEFEFGMSYSQNFATVPWLSIWVKTLIVVGQPSVVDPADGWLGNGSANNGLGGTLVPDWGINQQILAAPRAQVGINLGGYSVFALDTRGILANENYYTLDFGKAGSLTFLTILEFWAVPKYRIDHVADGLYKHKVLDLFALRVDYGISFAKIWRFTTKLAFRFGDDASAKAFGQSFQIRWENQIAVAVTEKFGMWAQLRYRIDNIANDKDVDNMLFLQAGLSYSLDLSGL